ncbi:STAS domain-containing protein [Streptomyces longispororuber]|uniref:STAS domain-containing protein n=1 Tax=Streptomyces longispororuber TaxID=68230 RepID=UPI00210B5391|nr:STAS domain-containing protein [Streptomyces longispororuber]MCQ4205658.1 STAS domain-containing protein [Streptomyces longispororuber]
MPEDDLTFGLRIRRQGVLLVVELWGELDVFAGCRLPDRLLRLLPEECHSLVLDLRDVAFMDCSGRSSLLRVHHRLKAQKGQLTVVVDNPFHRRLFRLMRVDRVLDVVESLDSALPPEAQGMSPQGCEAAASGGQEASPAPRA